MNKITRDAFLVLCLLAFAAAAAGQNWFTGTLDEALVKAKAENKLVLIDFFSAG